MNMDKINVVFIQLKDFIEIYDKQRYMTQKRKKESGRDQTSICLNGIYLNMNKNQRCLYSIEGFIRFTHIFFFSSGFVCFD